MYFGKYVCKLWFENLEIYELCHNMSYIKFKRLEMLEISIRF